jgi:hypothetical protein
MAAGFIQDRDSSRRFFLEVWKKHKAGLTLQALEKLVLGVLQEHPEYHVLLQQEEHILTREFTPEAGVTNPFLHMGMHIAIREQVASDRPSGIAGIYQQLAISAASRHDSEHRMMECLGEILWRAQRDNTLPDEIAYLECLKKLG